MRKVFLEQNLGKKSKCRFPKRNQKKIAIKLMIEAQKAISTPSLTQPLVISGVSVLEFCDRFNQETQNFENGLKVRSLVIVNQSSKTFDLQLISPSVYQLMRRVFGEKSRNKPALIAQLVHNIGLIKIVSQLGYNFYKADFKKFIKQITGNYRSYAIRFPKRNNKIKWQRINN